MPAEEAKVERRVGAKEGDVAGEGSSSMRRFGSEDGEEELAVRESEKKEEGVSDCRRELKRAWEERGDDGSEEGKVSSTSTEMSVVRVRAGSMIGEDLLEGGGRTVEAAPEGAPREALRGEVWFALLGERGGEAEGEFLNDSGVNPSASFVPTVPGNLVAEPTTSEILFSERTEFLKIARSFVRSLRIWVISGTDARSSGRSPFSLLRTREAPASTSLLTISVCPW
jgi:hypothetical protein